MVSGLEEALAAGGQEEHVAASKNKIGESTVALKAARTTKEKKL